MFQGNMVCYKYLLLRILCAFKFHSRMGQGKLFYSIASVPLGDNHLYAILALISFLELQK